MEVDAAAVSASTANAGCPLVDVQALPQSRYVAEGIVNKPDVLIQVKTGKQEFAAGEEQRVAMELCLVVDRSGSMEDNHKLKNAKRACKKVFKHLTVKDTVHLIVYDNKASVVFEHGDLSDKEALKQKVRELRTGGSTNMSVAMQTAHRVMTTKEKEEETPGGAIRRILLFSDGQANAGVATVPGLCAIAEKFYEQEQITTSTFGIGDDINEDLMMAMARAGRGDYFFIDSGPSIPRIMSKAIHGLMSIIGTSALLHVRGENGVLVSQVYGHYPQELVDGIKVGDLHTEATKQVLISLELGTATAAAASAAPAVKVLTYTLSYVPNGAEGGGKRVEMQSSLKLTYTDKPQLLHETASVEVAIASAIQKAAKTDSTVAELLLARRKGEAIKLKQELIQTLEPLENKDLTGHITKILKRARVKLADMQTERKSVSVLAKQARYEAKCEEDDDDFGFASNSDSDEGCYSDSSGGEAPAVLTTSGSPTRGKSGTASVSDSDSGSGSGSSSGSGSDSSSGSMSTECNPGVTAPAAAAAAATAASKSFGGFVASLLRKKKGARRAAANRKRAARAPTPATDSEDDSGDESQ
eukprot:TRINITY_DN4006_c0_g1_i2.p1 TRINITY_DN4006_c0_g1~~TRINITY_DN4006_c0_g1_i2.p1  ORF type:complete len:593 (-),score=174.48 TRINITY_DN4006_c0_g1_i2:680-2434(-)